MDITGITLIFTILLVIGIIILGKKIIRLEKNLDYMNLLLDRVARKIEVPEASLEEELKILIALDKKIPAIRKLSKEKGISLKEAKEYVEKLGDFR